ncbi:MAG TPA: hypothetical protein VFR21_06030 [Bradyrhizobium sp.]|nr:hypothetical protein [Bradyrhizobium sp.]
MTLGETGLVVDYYHSSMPEYLEMLGIDPTRLPPRPAWADRLKDLFALPVAERSNFYVVWLLDGRAVGFSSCDKINIGSHANMHLHVTEPLRQSGIGAACVHEAPTFTSRRLSCNSCSASRTRSMSVPTARCKRPASNVSRPT